MPRVKAVLDTNVIVSALLKADGRQALLLDLALSGTFTTIASRDLLQEYEEVLRRPRFALNPRRIAGSLRAIRKAAVLVQPRRHLHVTGDPDDNMVLECALEGGAEYVVTGNTRDFPREFQGIQIVPPRASVASVARTTEFVIRVPSAPRRTYSPQFVASATETPQTATAAVSATH